MKSGSFTVTCNNCGFERVLLQGDDPVQGHIELDVTENSSRQAESIDLYCSNCFNEINL